MFCSYTEIVWGVRVRYLSQNVLDRRILNPGKSAKHQASHNDFATHPAIINRIVIQDGNANPNPSPLPIESSKSGAGIYVTSDAVLELEEVRVTNCQAAISGGGVVLVDSSIRAKGCTFENNSLGTGEADSSTGGGVAIESHTNASETLPKPWERYSQIHNCRFLNNTAVLGGGLYAGEQMHSWLLNGAGMPGLSVANCLFANNSAGAGGGAWAELNTSSRMEWRNCTVTGNQTSGADATQFPSGNGAGLLFSTKALSGSLTGLRLANCIIKYNTVSLPQSGSNPPNSATPSNLEFHRSAGSSATLVNISVQQSNIGPHPSPTSFNPVWMAASPMTVDEKPGFANPSAGNFRLNPTSPCIDVGADQLLALDYLDLDKNGSTVMEKVPLDLDGLGPNSTYLREVDFPGSMPPFGITGSDSGGNVVGAICDLGCYEAIPLDG